MKPRYPVIILLLYYAFMRVYMSHCHLIYKTLWSIILLLLYITSFASIYIKRKPFGHWSMRLSRYNFSIYLDRIIRHIFIYICMYVKWLVRFQCKYRWVHVLGLTLLSRGREHSIVIDNSLVLASLLLCAC